jgi:ubiquinone/menaquinone biosynthesis C-methylase UbiE
LRNTSPNYGTWIRPKNIALFSMLSLFGLCLGALGFLNPWLTILGLSGVPFIYILFIIVLASYQFSDTGGKVQETLHKAIIESCPHANRIIDVGCGSGHLIIRYAQKYPESNCIGVDYWGQNWQYSKQQCELNANLEGVAGVEFIQGSASKLPFEDEVCDCIMSCLTFHEVQDVHDKLSCFEEALRVLKKGGSFTVFDLFRDTTIYPTMDEIRRRLIELEAENIETVFVEKLMMVPFPLMGKKALRYGMLIKGKKKG